MAVSTEAKQIDIVIPKPYAGVQDEFVRCVAKRQMNKSGRRVGKTYGVAIKASSAFLGVCWACLGEGCALCEYSGKVRRKRILYAAPTDEQVTKFWFEVVSTLSPGIEMGVFKKDETRHIIEIPGTEVRIRAKTAWNANTMRGDWGDVVIMEEYQLWNEDAWQNEVQPMLLDKDGTAIFIFTPPSLKSDGVSKAKDPRHASKLFRKAEADKTGRWATFHSTSYDNPYLSSVALDELTFSGDMTADTYRREILAQDDEAEQSWLVYGKWNEELCKIKRFEIPEHWDIFTGHDFGTANPGALFVARVKLPIPDYVPKYLRYGDYVAFHEYCPGAGYSAVQHVEHFIETLGKKEDLSPRLKLSGAVGGNATTEEETRQLYQKLGWFIKAPNISRVSLQIERGISVIEGNQLYVFEDLHNFLSQLLSCMWELDDNKIPINKVKDEAKYHLLACFRYLATLLQPRHSVFGEKRQRSRSFM
jgi:hypothetical protein